MSENVEIDKLDIKILAKLLEDSRTPFKQLARNLNVSESTIYIRVKKLRNSKILKSYTIDVDLNKLGFIQQVYVEIKATPQYLKNIIEELREKPNILEIYEVSGEYPLLIKVVATNNEELSSTIDEIAMIKGVTEMRVKYVFKTLESKNVSKVFPKLGV
ncbi:MAG: Lrp/AsnC family transcriptional regulator [Desulfurococcaceae archaeon TW002]